VRQRATTWIAAALVLLVVVLCAWPVAAFSMKHYLPEVDNDELMYFLLVKTFRSQGLHTGYSFTNDRVPAGPIHFNIQGPGTVPLYGQLSRLVGWTNYSPYLANLLLFVPSWLLFAYALRRHPHRQIAASVFVLANGYFFMFLPSMMQESFHLSVAIAMAALWLMAIERKSPWAWSALLVLTLAAMLVRYSWAVVLPCFLFSFVMQRTRTWSMWRRVLVSGLISLVGGAIATDIAVTLLVGWALPPAPAPQTAFSVPNVALGFSTARLVVNLKAVAQLKSMGMFADYPRYFLATVIATLAVFLPVALLANRDTRARAAAAWGFLILGGAVSAQVMFYTIDGWRDFRVLLPVHAFAGLMFFSRVDLAWDRWTRRTRAAVVSAAILLIAGNAMWPAKALRKGYWLNWSGNMPAIDEAGRDDFARLAPYLEASHGDSAFCKTVYANGELWGDARLAHMPDIFAVSAVEEERPGQVPPLRGKYALIKTEPPRPPSGTTRAHLRSLGIDPDNHEAIIGAELSGRVRQGRASGWADDDPANPAPAPPPSDLTSVLARSGAWRKVADVHDLTLFRSTVNCLSTS
jgi:hypothetical protein